jgi:hypothetical protein
LTTTGQSDSRAPLSPAAHHEGAASSTTSVQDDNYLSDSSDPLDQPMRTSDPPADLANQHDSIFEAPPSPVPARTLFGDDDASPDFADRIPIVSQLGSIESPVKRLRTIGAFSDTTPDSYPDILHSHLNALVNQFESFQKGIPFTPRSNKDLDFSAMQSIIDKRNLTFDGVSIDGIFNSDNPIAFAAGTKNNPDILSQAQMFKATDREQFIASQLPANQRTC